METSLKEYEYSTDDLNILTKNARAKISISDLIEWANTNILFGTGDPMQTIEEFINRNRIDLDTLKKLVNIYLGDIGYDESQGVQTAQQDVLVDLKYAIEDSFDNNEMEVEEASILEPSPNGSIVDTMKDQTSNFMKEGIDSNSWERMTNDEREEALFSLTDDIDLALSLVNYSFDSLPDSIASQLSFNEGVEIAHTTKEWGDSDEGTGGYGSTEGGDHKEELNANHNLAGKTMDDIKVPEKELGINETDKPTHKKNRKCRDDEKPVLGAIMGEPGSCEKKVKKSHSDSFAKAGDNEHNVKIRKKRETDYEKNIKKKNMEKKKETKVAEGKKPSALIQLDRLQKDNQKNFNADAKNSNTADKATEWADIQILGDYTDVDSDPQKAGADIEKEVLKQNKGMALDNVGDSANENNKEIPKRNLTDDEQGEIDIMRNGQHSWQFDNETNEKFEERMKADMGEEVWKMRKEQLAARENQPRYEKEEQPVTNESKNYDQFNESMLTGKYTDNDGKLQFVDFKINECKDVKHLDECQHKLNIDALGNTYTSLVNENVNMRNYMDSFNFYFDGSNVVKQPKGRQNLSEGEVKEETTPINEEIENMKKLMGYKPASHMKTPIYKDLKGFK
jgi:hypothetical protein